jgi:hypothetical protein
MTKRVSGFPSRTHRPNLGDAQRDRRQWQPPTVLGSKRWRQIDRADRDHPGRSRRTSGNVLFVDSQPRWLIPNPDEGESGQVIAAASQNRRNMLDHGKPAGGCHGGGDWAPGELTAVQLRALAKPSRDAAQTRRLLALAAIGDGDWRSAAASGCRPCATGCWPSTPRATPRARRG